MKKVLSLLAIAGMVALVSCGPSKKEQEEKEKAKADSIAKAEKEKATADSIAAAEAAAEALEKAKQDSIAKADSIANLQSSTKKPAKKDKPVDAVTKNKGGRG